MFYCKKKTKPFLQVVEIFIWNETKHKTLLKCFVVGILRYSLVSTIYVGHVAVFIKT